MNSGFLPEFSLSDKDRKKIARLIEQESVPDVEKACMMYLALSEDEAKKPNKGHINTNLFKLHKNFSEIAKILEDQSIHEELNLLIRFIPSYNKYHLFLVHPTKAYFVS